MAKVAKVAKEQKQAALVFVNHEYLLLQEVRDGLRVTHLGIVGGDCWNDSLDHVTQILQEMAGGCVVLRGVAVDEEVPQ